MLTQDLQSLPIGFPVFVGLLVQGFKHMAYINPYILYGVVAEVVQNVWNYMLTCILGIQMRN